MKKIFVNYMLPVFMVLAVTGCKKSFQELTQNNNVPSTVPASLLFNGILNKIADLPQTNNEIYCQYYLYNYDYYGNNRYDALANGGDNYYSTIKNVLDMEKQAAASGGAAVNPYEALGKFFRAYFFTKMSLEEGDIPMTEALKGLDNLTPAYDTQKAVMVQAFAWLESANADLTQLIKDPTVGGSGVGSSLTNDIYFNNDLSKWQKTVNTFRIRLLIALSKKTADIDVKTQFANIIGNPTKYPLMANNADNLQYTFVSPNNYYPTNPNNFGQNGSRQNMSATYVGLLTQLKDPRVFVTAEPSRYRVDTLKQSPTDFNSFVGADAGLDLGVMYNNATLQRYSFLNRKHFYSTYTGEPSVQIGYAELMFNIAEGINLGWASGDAEAYYVKGIQASFDSYTIPTGTGTFTVYFYRPGATKGTTDQTSYNTYQVNVNWNTYYAQPLVKYAGGATGRTQILQQRYLALFRHSGLESYFTYRRTGVPDFTTGPGTGNGSRIALRFEYPTSERTVNADNYNKALASQFGGKDDINGKMWILQ
ncbi:SusD/RagB family nutrient-binding outer membrane lipoprotein [Mucilaginibacter sabulilitoris]|uniref:SusD/RagB family nutrient-binding outer membrane lipoprotein n=1 Tax=Mucilaginibacter sabulilitoris TaxID=1173583 RepID=A0ABZ0TQC8_9SPHI|nr:SusD/RagB family nutrient-binding outer membrane lipoprotein [Mucilaginibacter sabulilitoris]WPU93355.1 SusD/RagB family nutrient-binding outer membrane lipoprotein [Mucilaginibacter sabulilitoris]